MRGSLCAFNAARDLDNPVWTDRIQSADILPELRERGLVAEQFGVSRAWVFDVFRSQPGDEIVAVFNAGPTSHRVLRIYDLTGKVRFQIWHDGAITHCHWMSEAGLLVFAGDCQWPYHDNYGNLLGDKVHHFVVFALRPEPGFIADSYLDYLSCQPGDERLDPAW